VGFASANNLGAKLARGRFLLFLNPDTEVVGDALAKLVKALEQQPDAGLAGAQLLNSDGSLQTSCIQSFPTILNQVLDSEWLRRIFSRSQLWGMAPLRGKTLSPSPVEVVSGACIMIKCSLFEKLSGFDQRFFMYSEDLDLCYRVRLSGKACLYVPDAIVVHHGGGASSSARSMFSVVMMRESVCRLLKFHRGSFVALGYRAALGCSAMVRLPLILGKMAVRKISGDSADSKSFRKWIAILRWSLGLELWARQQSGNGNIKPTPLRDSENRSAASAGTGV
jgi:GT2 family glycosyltransferase